MEEQFVQRWMFYSNFGRQEKVMHCVLIDRRFTRLLSIQTDYIGKSIDAIVSQKVKVFWKNKDGKDEVCLVNDQFFFFSIYISLIYITPFSYSFLIEKATQFRSVAIKFFGENPKLGWFNNLTIFGSRKQGKKTLIPFVRIRECEKSHGEA